MRNHRESGLSLRSTPPVATARGFIPLSSLPALWGLWPPHLGVMDSFLVPFCLRLSTLGLTFLPLTLHLVTRLA